MPRMGRGGRSAQRTGVSGGRGPRSVKPPTGRRGRSGRPRLLERFSNPARSPWHTAARAGTSPHICAARPGDRPVTTTEGTYHDFHQRPPPLSRVARTPSKWPRPSSRLPASTSPSALPTPVIRGREAAAMSSRLRATKSRRPRQASPQRMCRRRGPGARHRWRHGSGRSGRPRTANGRSSPSSSVAAGVGAHPPRRPSRPVRGDDAGRHPMASRAARTGVRPCSPPQPGCCPRGGPQPTIRAPRPGGGGPGRPATRPDHRNPTLSAPRSRGSVPIDGSPLTPSRWQRPCLRVESPRALPAASPGSAAATRTATTTTTTATEPMVPTGPTEPMNRWNRWNRRGPRDRRGRWNRRGRRNRWHGRNRWNRRDHLRRRQRQLHGRRGRS